jgi:hypothetical protein
MLDSIFNKINIRPNMTPAEAAKAWMHNNLCTDTGRAAIQTVDGIDVVRYRETPHGIIIMLNNGTGLPVPYKYNGDYPLLL